MKAESTNPCPSEPSKIQVTDLTKVYTAPAGTLIPPKSTIDPPKVFPGQPEIFVGSWGAVTSSTLKENNIMGVLNVAYDCDDLPPSNYDHNFNPEFQLAKVGLIDGLGNSTSTVVAAVLMADQLFNFPPLPQKPTLVNTYTPWMRGNLLIHCWDGGSRSITVAALYLYYKFGVYFQQEEFKTFELAYTSVINQRAPYAPNSLTPGMCKTANEIVNTYASLFPNPVLN